jgi:hypothetical protein
MDKMLFQFNRVGFCDDVHTKQRRALLLVVHYEFVDISILDFSNRTEVFFLFLEVDGLQPRRARDKNGL